VLKNEQIGNYGNYSTDLATNLHELNRRFFFQQQTYMN